MEHTKNNEQIELNSNSVNKAIKYNILSDEEMKRIGFHKNYYDDTDHEQYSPYWYFIKSIQFPKNGKWTDVEIDFNVKIPKDGSDINIMILDMELYQPYDYQYILSKNPDNECANIVKEQVEEWMKYLQDECVLSGHVYREYI